jgi:four helix bundle protein
LNHDVEVHVEGKVRNYDLEDRLIDFGVVLCGVAQSLPRTSIGTHIAHQLVRSGLSPAANYGEAQSAESRKDFIHKLKVCLKELRETQVWLKYGQRLGLGAPMGLEDAIQESDELIAIFVKSIETAARKHDRKNRSRSA